MILSETKTKNKMWFWKCGVVTFGLVAALLVFHPIAFAEEITTIEELKEGGMAHYEDIFDQSFYYEGVNLIDFGRWARKIFRNPIPSADVNIFDEVPDSTFFVNRHARRKMSLSELEKGASETSGPDLSKPLVVISIRQSGLNYQFLIEDVQGDQYLLKFDPQMYLGLNTAAEVIASRFYYAVGYNVPQYTTLILKSEQLKIDANSVTSDNTGFTKELTQRTLQRYLISIPQTPDGAYRASAQKISKKEDLGNFSFRSRQKSDPQDPVNHRDRREIRTLTVFAAWLNDTGLCESNTMDISSSENGQVVITHYLTNFTNALGASSSGPKSPMFGHEYMVDYGETFKTILALGFREKPWQKRWREADEKPHPSPAVGYFSNHFFDPPKFKTQLPYEAFKIVTRADGFWAAKNVISFSDEDIRAMVKAGQYSSSEDAEYIAKTLIERRDLIARYWFSLSAPLDDFEFSNGTLSFSDLAVKHGFESEEGSVYSATIFSTGKKLAELTSNQPEIEVVSSQGETEVVIRVSRPASSEKSPFVKVILDPSGIQGIQHEN